eukprot:364109-Chlamydomonas_euryale.AAC.2
MTAPQRECAAICAQLQSALRKALTQAVVGAVAEGCQPPSLCECACLRQGMLQRWHHVDAADHGSGAYATEVVHAARAAQRQREIPGSFLHLSNRCTESCAPGPQPSRGQDTLCTNLAVIPCVRTSQ